MNVQRLVALGLSGALLTGLGACAHARPAPPFAAPPGADQLRPDGSVPWVDEVISDDQLTSPKPRPTVRAGAKPCRASQLSGVLTKWEKPQLGGEEVRGFDANISKLYGYVDVRNVSAADCTLQGEVPATMLSGGTEVPMQYGHTINAAARERVTGVPAGGHASLRMDWSGPFCEQLDGPLAFAIEVPHQGGVLRAPITATDRPACNRGEVKPNVTGGLFTSGFTEPATTSTPPVSAIGALTATTQPPASITPGQPFTFHVVLANPTKTPIQLDPCPGYVIELFSMGDAGYEGVNTHQLYRLNCRPTATVPATGKVTYEMQATVPNTVPAGRRLAVTWRLVPADQVQAGKAWATFEVTVPGA